MGQPAEQHGAAARSRDPDLGAAYAGIAVGALAVLGATAVALQWLARRPAVRTLTVGPRGGWIAFRSVTPVRPTPATRPAPQRRHRRR